MNFNPETLSDWMMDKEEVESSLSESNEERFAQQTLYLDEPDMDEIQIKVCLLYTSPSPRDRG